MALTIPNKADVSLDARQAKLAQAHIDTMMAGVGGTGVLWGGAVTPQGTPNGTVAVAAGAGLSANVYVSWAAGNVTMPSADGSNPMWVLISVSSAGVKTATAGTAGTNPLPPATPAGHIPLWRVWWPASATAVTADHLADGDHRAMLPPVHSWEPWGYGLRAWSVDVATAYDSSACASGEINLIKLWNPVEQEIGTIHVVVRSAGSGLTANQNYAGLYSPDGSRLAVTGNMASTWNSSGHKAMSLTAPVTLPAGWVYAALLANGTTRPSFARGIATAAGNLGLGSGQLRWATILSGQTSLPSSLTMSSMTEHGLSYWVGLS